MSLKLEKYSSIIFTFILINFLFINSYPLFTSLSDVYGERIVVYVDKDIESEKDQKEDESKEKSEYYIHKVKMIYQDQVKLQMLVLHLENFKNLIIPPFSPPPEYC